MSLNHAARGTVRLIILSLRKHAHLSINRTQMMYKWLDGFDTPKSPTLDMIGEAKPEGDVPEEDTPEGGKLEGNVPGEDKPEEDVPGEDTPEGGKLEGDVPEKDTTDGGKPDARKPEIYKFECDPQKKQEHPLSYDALHRSVDPYRPPQLRGRLISRPKRLDAPWRRMQ